jgi:hypothetical protein
VPQSAVEYESLQITIANNHASETSGDTSADAAAGTAHSESTAAGSSSDSDQMLLILSLGVAAASGDQPTLDDASTAVADSTSSSATPGNVAADARSLRSDGNTLNDEENRSPGEASEGGEELALELSDDLFAE